MPASQFCVFDLVRDPLRGEFAKRAGEDSDRGWRADFAVDDDFARGNLLFVNVLVGRLVLCDHGALQLQPAEKPPAARIRNDLGFEQDVSRYMRVAPDRPRRDAGSRADFEFVHQQAFNARFVHDQQDEVYSLSADLQPEAAAADGEVGGRPPRALRPAATDQALAVLPADDEAPFFD